MFVPDLGMLEYRPNSSIWLRSILPPMGDIGKSNATAVILRKEQGKCISPVVCFMGTWFSDIILPQFPKHTSRHNLYKWTTTSCKLPCCDNVSPCNNTYEQINPTCVLYYITHIHESRSIWFKGKLKWPRLILWKSFQFVTFKTFTNCHVKKWIYNCCLRELFKTNDI